MKLASSWLQVVEGHKSVIVGVYIPGRKRVVATVHVSSRPTQWLEVLGQLSEGIWFDSDDPKLTRSTARIGKLLVEINKNAGTDFQLVSRLHYSPQMGPEVGLVGG